MNEHPHFLKISQIPPPGTGQVMFCGDAITFTLSLSSPSSLKGRAWVRTNLGAARISRKEIIEQVEKDRIKLGKSWFDHEMIRRNENTFDIHLPLHQTGYFQAKCFFIPDGKTDPVWPDGENVGISVEPPGTCSANIIYNAFIRQFNHSGTRSERPDALKTQDRPDKTDRAMIQALDQKGYTVIPESGKFRDLIQELEFIFVELGCRILHLLPIHPTPTTYARMGRFGSPYAALNFTDVDPALARFDPKATPLEQFMELVDMVHFYGGYLFMDIAINHTGWAAAIHETHPEWLVRDAEGNIEAPGAWGVVWEDLTKLDYSNKDLWKYMADIFLLWCRRGVDGFRCDAGYMIPVEAWEYMVAKVREQFPNTLFFLEGLGGAVETTCDILTRANFNWAYSELFQTYTKEELATYLPRAWKISQTCGHLIHFAETHDNNRLAAVSPTYAKMRTAISALFSVCGGFGFTNGVEWFATEKINVHDAHSLNWGSRENQVEHISRLNRILKTHPCFFAPCRLNLVDQDNPHGLVLHRYNPVKKKTLYILANLDWESTREITWHHHILPYPQWHDLVSGKKIETKNQGALCTLILAPGEVLAASPHGDDLVFLKKDRSGERRAPDQVLMQKYKAGLLTVLTAIRGFGHLESMNKGAPLQMNMEKEASAFAGDPIEYIRALDSETDESGVIPYDIPEDLRRQVMIPPGFFLLIRAKFRFRACIMDSPLKPPRCLESQEGIPAPDGTHFFALFSPLTPGKNHRDLQLNLRIFEPEGTRVESGGILGLAPIEQLTMGSILTRNEMRRIPDLKLLSTTRTGGMMRAAADFGKLDSRYDGLLGANLNPHYPEDRRMVWAGCRAWGMFQGYSRTLGGDCLASFRFSYGHGGTWRFFVPTSEGNAYILDLYLTLDRHCNRVSLSVHRNRTPKGNPGLLKDDIPITLILRPDLENRPFHQTVKAFTGPETHWPQAISVAPDNTGVSFSLSDTHRLDLTMPLGQFVHRPEWQYQVYHPLEAERGLDAESDLFSPGYFTTSLRGGENTRLTGTVSDSSRPPAPPPDTLTLPGPVRFRWETDLAKALYRSLDAFIVNRDDGKSVIAGFPWFLDWGRDSLIFCRSLIQLERWDEALAILKTFGRFERQGTLPNMICGEDARNIETSDAPLWFFACCKDLVEKRGSVDVLEEKAGNRSLKEILLSMGNALTKGTPTGVKSDPDTGMLYSPSHFTWMDTNFPACSPRQGYPVEIQALWYNGLMLLAALDPDRDNGVNADEKDYESNKYNKVNKEIGKWQRMALQLKKAIVRRFWQEELGYFSDCLHASVPPSPNSKGAESAEPDDALRPNQLLLITLGVIEEKNIARKTVETCLELLVPGAIRSLADRPLTRPLTIEHQGKPLTDPHAPYCGTYQGDEDTRRKPAYHNGTAWTWQFPIFCEAWAIVFGKPARKTALAWLGSVSRLMRTGAAGYIPEILDGDMPHSPRGCDAQAWGSSESARVIHKLQ